MEYEIYNCEFYGRKVGSLGHTYRIEEELLLPAGYPDEKIRLKLYDRYEHISSLKINGKRSF